eukprot:1774025-Pyramimonas_sp.AAC.1
MVTQTSANDFRRRKFCVWNLRILEVILAQSLKAMHPTGRMGTTQQTRHLRASATFGGRGG